MNLGGKDPIRSPAVVLALTAVMLAACGAPGITGPIRRDVLFVRTPGGIQVLSAATGEHRVEFRGGVASPDYTVVASTRARGEATVVERLSPAGDKLTRAVVPGELQARIVSGSGRLVALTGPRRPGASLYVPAGRKRTRVVVLEESGRYRNYVLKGNFEPEAFSFNDRELFLIEYIPARAPERYRVRRLLLRQGRVVPIGRLKIAAPEQMQGTGRMQVHSPDGEELYTLYTQQANAGHEATASAGEAHAFVHVLNLKRRWAHCIDLPHSFGMGRATASAVAVTPDGTRIYVVDWTTWAIGVIRPQRLRVTDAIDVALGLPDDETFAQASDDRLFVGGNSEVVVLHAESLEVLARWPMSAQVTGLRLSPDAERLHVSVQGEIVSLDSTTGEVLNTVETTAVTAIEHVGS